MDSAREQRKLEARKILENAAESPQVAFSQWLGSFFHELTQYDYLDLSNHALDCIS
jgi:hypothetical protein